MSSATDIALASPAAAESEVRNESLSAAAAEGAGGNEKSAAKEKPKRRSTSHLKIVPEPKALREALKAECKSIADKLDKSRPLAKDELEKISRELLNRGGHPEGFLGWTMVVLATEFWRDQVAAIPPSRRLFLLPHCLKHAEGCPADYDEFGLDCRKCGACSIADFRTLAEDLGHKVLVSEGTPIVLKIIVSGHVDAIVGVACLNVLEKAIDKIVGAGIACMAVPLLSSDCRNTSVDEDWVLEMIKTPHVEPKARTRTYLHLMRAAGDLFQPARLAELLPRTRGKKSLAETPEWSLADLDALGGTEAIAHDFLAQGGKYLRPFATLAVYDALTGGRAEQADGAEAAKGFSEGVYRTALAIEVFHKASLVHDDIEDDDAFRYGQPTLHRRVGVATAINAGDYLVGAGYRLVSREAKTLGPDVVADILDRLADAHVRLAEGQGAELIWRDSKNKALTPLDALKIYALKTAPAFEVALMAGARLAGPLEPFLESIPQFSKHLGVAFQILNDLKDWRGDVDNKLAAGGDVLAGRPTVLWALACEALPPAAKAELLQLAETKGGGPAKVERVRKLYEQAGVFEKAAKLVDKYQQRAEQIADELQPEELRRLFYYFVDTVLDRAGAVAEPPPPPQVFNLVRPLPIVAARG